MTYFHIRDLIPESDSFPNREEFENYYKIPGTLKNRCIRYFKSNLGKKNAFSKMIELIETETFVNLEQADKMLNWERAPSVLL